MKINKSQLSQYLKLNRDDIFDILNPVKDILQKLILDPINIHDDKELSMYIEKLLNDRSSSFTGRMYLPNNKLLDVYLHTVPRVDKKSKTIILDPRVPLINTVVTIINSEDNKDMKEGSFIFTTKNYPDLFCDSGKWYIITYDSNVEIVSVICR